MGGSPNSVGETQHNRTCTAFGRVIHMDVEVKHTKEDSMYNTQQAVHASAMDVITGFIKGFV